MPFISYAQNREDVMLQRLFSKVSAGTYVDVGAGDPTVNSVTRAFYDRGWSGINVEPLPRFFDRLVSERPLDVNLHAAIGAQGTAVTLFVVEGYEELSTTVPEIADTYEKAGRQVRATAVPRVSLAEATVELAGVEVHFLKVDVEGAELEVLASADFRTFRPQVILVESVTFGEAGADVPEWHGLLENADYTFVYFDGLNRFYLAAERYDELKSAFDVPVNVRDGYVLPSRLRSAIAMNRVAELLGAVDFSDEQEVVERVQAVIADRIMFENEAVAAQAARDATLTDLSIAKENLRVMGRQLSELRVEVDAFYQQQFERERYIAWQAGAIHSLRNTLSQTPGLSESEAAAQAALASVLSSTSWRLSLPLRVLRRPAHYLRRGGRR